MVGAPLRAPSAAASVAVGLGTPVQWVTPAPLWSESSADPRRMQMPLLLRFASDSFMDDLANMLRSDPRELATLKARPESFRARPVGAALDWKPSLSDLKLYQPTHGHFYLVAAHLVCRLTGLPDRVVDTSQDERAAFVLRRLSPDGTSEMAWIHDPKTGKGWQPIPEARERSILPGEDCLPLCPMTYTDPLTGRRRRLLVGLVPTSSRESFQAAPALSPISVGGAPPDPRLDDADGRVIEPLAALRAPVGGTFGEPSPAARAAAELQEQEASRFLLLDLAEILSITLPDLWSAIYNGSGARGADRGAALYRLLTSTRVEEPDRRAPTWAEALRIAWDQRTRITGEVDGPPSTLTVNLRRTALTPQALRAALAQALGKFTPDASRVPPPADAAEVPKLDPRPGTRYVLRCVYQRPACGPLQPDVVSAPTEPFAIASFFDVDAPSRPVRITLPVDTSIAGLRGFKKNVAFLISDQLRSQMSRATDLKKALDGNLASGESFDIGLLCSFSIPVITICALVVLMLFVFLLNIVFWWVPFLRICLPLGLKAR